MIIMRFQILREPRTHPASQQQAAGDAPLLPGDSAVQSGPMNWWGSDHAMVCAQNPLLCFVV